MASDNLGCEIAMVLLLVLTIIGAQHYLEAKPMLRNMVSDCQTFTVYVSADMVEPPPPLDRINTR